MIDNSAGGTNYISSASLGFILNEALSLTGHIEEDENVLPRTESTFNRGDPAGRTLSADCYFSCSENVSQPQGATAVPSRWPQRSKNTVVYYFACWLFERQESLARH